MTTQNSHIISGGKLTAMLGDANYLPWSFSRMDTAGSCLFKFKRVYLEGEKESSDALTLGSLSHEIIAQLLEDRDPSIDKAEIFLAQHYPKYKDADPEGYVLSEVRKLFPYMVEFVTKWLELMDKLDISKYRVEHAYGLTEEFTRASCKNGLTGAYFRGIVDLWGYDPVSKTLYIVDHKTNKSAMSSKKVKEHKQLNVYVAMLAAVYGLEWNKAYIGLNFLRKGKIVWATVTPNEVEDFIYKFRNTLHYLETSLYGCENSMVWPAQPSFKCNWCSFRESCTAYKDMRARVEANKKQKEG